MTARPYPWKRPRGWWLRNPRYLSFQLREAGGVVSALYGLILLNMLLQLRAGESAYTAFLDTMRTPPMLFVNLVLFALVGRGVVPLVSGFSLTGEARPIRFTEKPIPWKSAFAVNLVLWLGV